MRSCKYCKVPGSAECCTKLLTFKNIRFFHDRCELHHSNPTLHLANSISITFEYQKNDERDVTITMHQTGDSSLCPVTVWASIGCHIRSLPGTTDNSHICTYQHADGSLGLVTSKQVLDRIRDRVRAIGKEVLGFDAEDVGTHSIWSTTAMAMCLAGVPVYTIMLIGRWSSNAFLHYIHHQVQEFSAGVSRRMIVSDNFFTIPEFASTEDPRNHHHRHNYTK